MSIKMSLYVFSLYSLLSTLRLEKMPVFDMEKIRGPSWKLDGGVRKQNWDVRTEDTG